MHNRSLIHLVFLFLFSGNIIAVNAQNIAAADVKKLRKMEDTLKQQGRKMIMDEIAPYRFRADSFFTRVFVRALKTPNSFYYPFDSVLSISKLYAPDSSFRIYTWEFRKDESYYRQRGAIQMKTADGSLRLIPLFDVSEFTKNPLDSVRSNQNWIGAIYYNMVMKTAGNKKYYTLFGYDNNNFRSNRKWIEVLTFDSEGMPRFGGRYFSYKQDDIKPPVTASRFLLEYKKDAAERVIYDEELDMIVFEHLISETAQPELKHTLIPDGDYEGFKWQDGRWVHVEKVFNYKMDMRGVDPMLGNPPLDLPILDAKGNKNLKQIELNEKSKQQEAERKLKDAERKKEREKGKVKQTEAASY